MRVFFFFFFTISVRRHKAHSTWPTERKTLTDFATDNQNKARTFSPTTRSETAAGRLGGGANQQRTKRINDFFSVSNNYFEVCGGVKQRISVGDRY
jgi:hypothetical protein